MRVAFLTVCLSPHQLPLADAIVANVGETNFRYISDIDLEGERIRLGWGNEPRRWCISRSEAREEADIWCREADVLYSCLRELDIFEERARRGLKTVYVSERWFKPIALPVLDRMGVLVPGRVRMLHPGFRRMAARMRRLLDSDIPFWYFPMGVHAADDMSRLCGWGRPIFSRPEPGEGFRKMRLWGYFVEKAKQACEARSDVERSPLRVLWVGRLLRLKRVDTIIRAVRAIVTERTAGIVLDIYGTGPDEERLRNCVDGCGSVQFHPSVSIAEVRTLMRAHDVYVFSSNGLDGWGAVVNEALEEGMHVLGTYEAGGSATMLSDEDLFHAGDWRRLKVLLERCHEQKCRGELKGQGIRTWSVDEGVERLMTFLNAE